MPELPEVETIRNILRIGSPEQPPIVGKLIQGVQVLWSKSIAYPSIGEFQDQIAGQLVLEIGRRGKYLLIYLSNRMLIIHLRMSGDLLVQSDSSPLSVHDRVIFYLEGAVRLVFNDPRKFGRVWLVINQEQVLSDLGPEPLDPNFEIYHFHRKLLISNRQLKPLLMDQKFLAGLGNIYTDEALYLAHLHPLLKANTLTFDESARLLDSIRSVLDEGIRRNGASIDWVYRGGDFQNYFHVYQRTGEGCLECGTAIERIIVSQRSTHYCPKCQPPRN